MRKYYVGLSKIKRILLSLVVFCCISNLFADGLPSEFYVTQRWRDFLAGHSPATNPAFMTEENYIATRFVLSPTVKESFILSEFGLIVPIGLYQSIGASYLGQAATKELQQTHLENGIPVNDSIYHNDIHSLYILSYAINPWNRFSVGANLNLYHKTNFGDAITGLGFDLAFSYRLANHSILGDHVLGLNFQNLVSPSFSSSNFFSEAANLKISWMAKFWEKRIDAGIDLDIKDFAAKGEAFVKKTATGDQDAAKQIEFDFNARLGFWFLRIINIYLQAGSNYLGITPGLNVPTINNGRDFQIAYQYMSIVDNEALTYSHTVYFRGDFGKHREEVYARRMARLASIGPADLYNRARNLYAQGKYWESFFIFGKILVEYPDFFKNDWVQLHMGMCQENLDMKEFSAENFNITKKSFPRSVVVPYADLGLMRLHYREGNSGGVANQFSKLNDPSVPDTLRFHAYYYMGLQHIKDKEVQKAIQILSLVPENHPEYAFAQHSLAVAYALTNNMSMSIEALDNVIQVTPKTKEQTEVINRSFIFLGYIFYEGIGGQERSLSRSISALRKIPATSYYYEDALIGIAWTALRASQWVDCVASCDQIIATTKKPVLECEALLLKGYCAMIDKKYKEAVAILTPAAQKLTSEMGPAANDKNAKTLEFDNNRGVYYEVAAKMNNLALTSQSSFTLAQIDSLHTPQIAYEKKLREYYNYSDEFIRGSFFARNADNVRSDVEYALAKAEKMAGMTGAIKAVDQAKEKVEKIDEEMEKLQNELKKLEQDE